MTGDDLLKNLETVYVLPDSSLTFVTARELSPEVLRYAVDGLEKIFPTQKVNLITAVHTVLVEHKPIYEYKAENEGAEQPVYELGKEGPCGCISDFGD